MRDRQSNPLSIRRDHLARYEYARLACKGPVLDAACGIGYGAYALATAGHEVTAVDIEPEAITLALKHYDDEKVVRWIRGNILDKPWGESKFRTIVCFETLEHLDDAPKALRLFRESMDRDDGVLHVSVPNERAMPFDAAIYAHDKYPHRRHYTPEEFRQLLDDASFEVIRAGSQLTKVAPVTQGSAGVFLVYTARPI